MKTYIVVELNDGLVVMAKLCIDDECTADYHFFTEVEDKIVGHEISNALNAEMSNA
jgi:hypothetical protein